MKHGFLLIDKPKGPTSHDIVQLVRKALGEPKVGHLGTLDPAASGLLVLAVGAKALKVLEFFQHAPKQYTAELLCGKVSSTYDSEGQIETYAIKPGWVEPDLLRVRTIIEQRFLGSVQQVPPAHSAVHIGGVRAYQLARAGEDVQMPERTVIISACAVLSFNYPHIELSVQCGSGTYIRSLAHDLGEALRCGAYLAALRRTKVKDWSVEDAVQPDDVSWNSVIPLKEIMKAFPALTLSDKEFDDIRHGRSIAKDVEPGTIAWHHELPVAVLVSGKEPGTCRPRKVLV